MLSVPNLLSLLRMGLVPLFIIAVVDGQPKKALAIFLLAGLTDALDGFIARFWDQHTLLGTYLDPAADKLLLTSAYVVLAIPTLNPLVIIPVWVTVLVIARDVVIVVMVVILHITTGLRSFPPAKTGKITTTAQIVTVLALLVVRAFPSVPVIPALAVPLIYLTAALTVISGLHYVVRSNRMVIERGEEPQ